ncbi:type IV pilus assembly protein PilC [Glaciihabitans tibetensis]|uniref:Type IV pilus assembly protein PilC n=1 Tax=Glaciihabitans tibetensis TaxID=1266600 RepID=A0A2T0VBF7_9MICO|nr:type II secretion system F family protein [Glaciihabitans tibetensis]PRY67536.1 type IV pilus assembly protein PilC [Glaciihabitans tibetensis]
MSAVGAVDPLQSWAYKGTDSSGKAVRGRIEARTEATVTARLRAQGISPSAITVASAATGLNRDISIPGLEKRISLADLAVMSRQLATMISSGITLLRTLSILAEQTENPKLAGVLRTVRGDVEGGMSLSDALAKHPRDFPPLMLNLVRTGETSGFLERALDAVANNYESEVKLRGTIRSALTYPVVVFVMAILAVIGMLLFIVPVFEQMFADFDSELPLPTLVLVALSDVMAWVAPVLLVLAIVGGIWWRRHRHEERVRQVLDPLLLKLPVFGPLLQKVAIARFSRNFATMIGAGVPILKALGIVGATSGNWVVERALFTVQESVRHGRSIAAPLAEEPVFPAMVTQMIAVGEDAGALEPMLDKISAFYDQEVEATTSQLTALIEPIMIASVGVVIGGMIVALYLPIFSIFDQIR